MEDIKQIGLNIWGLRGGHKYFCYSDGLNINSLEIARTWLDIREFLYVSDLTVRFYALEYTPQYKVFTLYRPENDTGGRSGAYVATTLYVPHNLKVNRTLDLLQQISDAYHNDHYDAFGNPNTNPDYVQVYLELIKNYASNIVREHDARTWEGSAQNGIPKILPYTNISTVEQFFDKPYRKEFLMHQEVMFWDVDYLQNQQSYGITFPKREILSTLFDTDGKNIAPQFEGGAVRNAPSGCTIERFEREGIDINQNWRSCFFYDKTNVNVVLKKLFHHPLTYQGSMIGIGSPFVKRGDDYDFSPQLDFQPCHYEIPVNVANVVNASFTLYFGNQPVNISNGSGKFTFDGNQANGSCKVTLRPDGVKEVKVTDFPLSKFFVAGSDTLDRMQPCIIESLKVLRFQFNQECRGTVNMRWTGASIGFNTYNKVFEMVLPAECKVSDFTVNVDGYKVYIKANDNDTVFDVTLTKQSYNVDIVVPESVKRYLSFSKVVLKVGGKNYKGLTAIIPIADSESPLNLSIDVDGRGNLLACEFDKRHNNDDLVLLPKLALLVNSTNEKLRLNAPNTAFDVFAGNTIVVPSNYIPALKEADKYNIDTLTDSEGVKKTAITTKVSTNTSGYQGGSGYTGYQGGYQGGNTSVNKPYYGVYWYEGMDCKLYDDGSTIKKGNDTYETIIDGHMCILCFDKGRHILPEKQKKYMKANKKNGFIVDVNNGRYTVVPTFSKSNTSNGGGNGGKDGKCKKRWWLLGGIGLAVLLLIVVFILIKKGKDSEKNTISFIGNHNSLISIEVTYPKKGTRLQSPKVVEVDPKCDVLSIKIKCDKEGDKDTTIRIESAWFNEVIHEKTIKVNTKAWDEIENPINVNNSIQDWGYLAENYPSNTIKGFCAEKAFDIVLKEPNKQYIEQYKLCFPSYYETEIDDLYNSGILVAERFKEALRIVLSLDCSQAWIDSLKQYNDSLNNYYKQKYGPNTNGKNTLCYDAIGDPLNSASNDRNNTDRVNTIVIKRQKEFFNMYSQARGINDVNKYAKNEGSNGFSQDQKNVISKIILMMQGGETHNIADTTTYKDICRELNIQYETTNK